MLKKQLNIKGKFSDIYTPDFFLFILSSNQGQSLFSPVVVSFFWIFWILHHPFGVVLCSFHLSLRPDIPGCPPSCQEQQESLLLENAPVGRTLCFAVHWCHSGSLPSIGAENQRSLEVPEVWRTTTKKSYSSEVPFSSQVFGKRKIFSKFACVIVKLLHWIMSTCHTGVASINR